MSTKIEYDDAISTISILLMVKSCPNIYNILKLEEILNTHLSMIPSTQSFVVGWARIFMRPEKHALSEPNLWQDPVNPETITPDVGKINTKDVEFEHHHDLWRRLKNQQFIPQHWISSPCSNH